MARPQMTKRVVFHVPKDIRDRARESAEGEGYTLAVIVRAWLLGFVDGKHFPPGDETLRSTKIYIKQIRKDSPAALTLVNTKVTAQTHKKSHGMAELFDGSLSLILATWLFRYAEGKSPLPKREYLERANQRATRKEIYRSLWGD